VGVVGQLLGSDGSTFSRTTKKDYGDLRDRRSEQRGRRSLLPLAEARRRKLDLDWSGYVPPRPSFLGRRLLAPHDLRELPERIDWTPFFRAWEIAGKFPALLDDAVSGEQTRHLFDDARRMLERLVAESWLEPRAVLGFWPANSVGDDVEIYTDASRRHVRTRLAFLRQQAAKSGNRAETTRATESPGAAQDSGAAQSSGTAPHLCLADFVAPRDGGTVDYVGLFAVTAGVGIEAKLATFEAEHDDYSGILLKALADRLAEALAERLHERVRRELWGYAPEERLGNEELIQERYQGIRPAPGYPACPDHTLKRSIWELLDVDEAGIHLTENLAMHPAASVSGFYFSHPQARYFGTGRIAADQVEDYARRRGLSRAEVERWLAPVLADDA
jgi:5-methyltetrahydrofolate--homocysteine methyltransferase